MLQGMSLLNPEIDLNSYGTKITLPLPTFRRIFNQ